MAPAPARPIHHRSHSRRPKRALTGVRSLRNPHLVEHRAHIGFLGLQIDSLELIRYDTEATPFP
jgi:hypothetical protein